MQMQLVCYNWHWVRIVDADGLVLKHQAISSNNVDQLLNLNAPPGVSSFKVLIIENCKQFAEDVFNCIFLKEKHCVLTEIPQEIIPKSSIYQ